MITDQSPDTTTTFRDLLTGALAPVVDRRVLNTGFNASSRTLSEHWPQNGGVAVNDIAGTIPVDQWTKVAREFFLT
jgi:hypothetical protein